MPAVPFPRIPLAFLPAPYAVPGRGQGGFGKRCFPTKRPRVEGTAARLPNEPKRLKTLVINQLAHEAEKQTQARYQPSYQSLTAILAPILKKYEWNYERSCDVL